MLDGFADRGEIAPVPKCCRTDDVPQFSGQKRGWRNSRLPHFLVTEELVLRVAKVMTLQIRVGPYDGAPVGRGFQPGGLPLFGHIETEQCLRLHSEMLIHPFISKLAQRYGRAILVKSPDNEIGTHTPNAACIYLAVRTSYDVAEVDPFCEEVRRNARRAEVGPING